MMQLDAKKFQQGPRLTPGTQAEAIYKALRLDEWIPRNVLAKICDLSVTTISSNCTHLRRTGWVEYREGPGARELQWRRRAQWATPQPDLISRGPNAVKTMAAYTEPTVAEHLEHARHHINKAMEAVGDIAAAQEALANIRMTRERF